MDRRLDFLVIGAQKCATSWLYYCLKDHPGLSLPEKKREVEYLGGDLYLQKGADWYFSLFKDTREGQVIGAVSIEYIFDARSPEVVRRLAPGVKLIASLRNPIDRAVSGYFWCMRKGMLASELTLEKAIRTGLEEVRLHSEKTQCAELLMRGLYDIQIDRYFRFFSPEQFLFLLYEDIQERPLDVMKQIYKFLGVDPMFIPGSLGSRPKQNTYLKPLIALERLAGRSAVLGKVMDVVNNAIAGIGKNPEKPKLSAELYSELSDFFEPHVLNAQKLIDKTPRDQRPFSSNLMKAWFGKGQK